MAHGHIKLDRVSLPQRIKPQQVARIVTGSPSSNLIARMLRLTLAPNLMRTNLWADARTHGGIEANVRRQYLASAAGALPPDQCLPEVWVVPPSAQLNSPK